MLLSLTGVHSRTIPSYGFKTVAQHHSHTRHLEAEKGPLDVLCFFPKDKQPLLKGSQETSPKSLLVLTVPKAQGEGSAVALPPPGLALLSRCWDRVAPERLILIRGELAGDENEAGGTSYPENAPH